jgi:hypothetical protein
MDKDKETKKKTASPLQVAKAVFWAFVGIRKKSDLEADAEMLTPVQVIVGGLIGGAIFILSVLLIVRIVIS